jgi:ketosteroid isomerase-like protein
MRAVEELRELQAEQRRAHLAGDAAAMAAMFADDFVTVADGVVSRPSRDESLQRFERYFDLVTFLAWEDIDEPVIEVAADGSLATVLVTKHVHVAYPGDDGVTVEGETYFAWGETWRRSAEKRWELAMVVSTRRPVQ